MSLPADVYPAPMLNLTHREEELSWVEVPPLLPLLALSSDELCYPRRGSEEGVEGRVVLPSGVCWGLAKRKAALSGVIKEPSVGKEQAFMLVVK